MNQSSAKVSDKLQYYMGVFSGNVIIKTISQGMFKLFPLTAVGSLAALLSNLGIPPYQDFIAKTGIESVLQLGTTITMGLISIYVVAALSYEMADHYRKNKATAVLFALMSFFIVTPIGSFVDGEATISAISLDYLGSKGMFVGMIVAMVVTKLYAFILDKKWIIKMPASVPPNVSTSFAALIPGFIIGLLMLLVNWLFSLTAYTNIHDFIYAILQKPLEGMGSSIWALMFLMFFSEVLWFFGIHGSMTTSAILYTLYQPLDIANLEAFMAHSDLPNIITKTFIDTFKGPRHLALALVLLLMTRSKHLKTVGKIAIAPGFFGISEPMKFGIPMILNPVIFIPMTLAPVISVASAYLATLLGILPRITGVNVGLPFPFIGAAISTNSWRGAAFSIFQMVLIMLLYIPFIKILDKQNLKDEQEPQL
ncbi:PTS sugar transporter subunit IIC [Vagococcus sp. BWB3-3]|uniref:Permease IIC component n=1 Tax=Vagococcus allomyrinae TaxID=2794353 RepID=A0A940P7D2_9ENTE|nr:PTS transporter subunit EIIC [Vagococcus allomyrinae]MBP1043024.1 PTS sugar transporter subunit IIC [Vagococcus allomyrinae]